MTQAVLQQFTVYWAHIFRIPKETIVEINKIIASFIWSGGKERKTIHLARLECLTKPKEKGGWGLLDLDTFGKALLFKSMWRCITKDCLWADIIRIKYIDTRDPEDILITGWEVEKCRSEIWRGFSNCWGDFKENLVWRFGAR